MFGIDDLFFLLAGTAYVTVKGISAGADKMLEKDRLKRMNSNPKREIELISMACSADPKERAEFDKMVGRVVNRSNGYEVREAIREIAKKEGWTCP